MLSEILVCRFGKKFASLFRTRDYLQFATELEIETFDSGGCFMVARALRRIFGPIGKTWVVASYDKDSHDWPVEHYLLSLPTKERLFLDSLGAFTGPEVLARVAGWKRDPATEFRLGRVGSKWPNGNLWHGEHNYVWAVVSRIVQDGKKILKELRRSMHVGFNTTCPRCGAAPEDAKLEVVSGTFCAGGVWLEKDGFSLLDSKRLDTEDELVYCHACGERFSLSECSIEG